jgi:hypothetical protein
MQRQKEKQKQQQQQHTDEAESAEAATATAAVPAATPHVVAGGSVHDRGDSGVGVERTSFLGVVGGRISVLNRSATAVVDRSNVRGGTGVRVSSEDFRGIQQLAPAVDDGADRDTWSDDDEDDDEHGISARTTSQGSSQSRSHPARQQQQRQRQRRRHNN